MQTSTTIDPTEATLPSAVNMDHLSWSSIQTFRTCPRKFFHKYVRRDPEESVAAALIHGGALHRAVERVHQLRLLGDPLPDVDELLRFFDLGMQDGLGRGVPVLFAKDESVDSLRDLAARMLSAYMTHMKAEPSSEVIGIEHAQRVRLVPRAPEIETRLDLIELRGEDLVITDLKSSRSKWGDDKARENLPQLVLYAHAVLGQLEDLGAKRVVLRFVVVTKGKNPVVQVLSPAVSHEDSTRVKQLVSDCWQAISTATAFHRREGWQCKQCPFRKRCLGAGA